MLSPPQERSDTRTPSDGQYHESQWQQDRSRTDLKGKNVVKNWSKHGTIIVNSSLGHEYYHYQKPALITPCSDLDCGQPQGHHAGAPSQRYQTPGNNYVTPPQLPISLQGSRHIFIPGNSQNRFGITWKKTVNEPLK